MKLHWKFFLILVISSLTPLLGVTVVSHHGAHEAQNKLYNQTRETVTEIVGRELLQAARNYSTVMIRTKNLIEYTMLLLVREAEAALAQPSLAEGKIYFDDDFDHPDTAPPDLVANPSFVKPGEAGSAAPLPVSYDHMSFIVAPGVSREAVKNDAARLNRLAPKMINLGGRLGNLIYQGSIILENGLTGVLPGHGGYPANHDPRLTPAYLDANHDDLHLEWSPPYLDAATGKVVYSVSRLIHRPDHTVAGAVALDVYWNNFMEDIKLAYRWSDAMTPFLVAVHDNRDTGRDGLLIRGQKDYRAHSDSKSNIIEFEWLTSSDNALYDALVADIGKGGFGTVRMPYRGVPSIWAYSAQFIEKQHLAVVLIVPTSVAMALPEKVGQTVIDLTEKQRHNTIIAAIVVVCLVAIISYFGARAAVRSVLELVTAAGRLSEGDFTVRLSKKWNDERDMVCECFNSMVPKLEDHLRISESLELAQEVQQNLLPKEDPVFPGLDLAGLSRYCDETGGDYYDFIPRGNEENPRLVIVVGDVAGHGIPSALLMASARALVRLRSNMPGTPSDVMRDINHCLSKDTADTGQFITMFYMEFDISPNRINWVRAGHEPALVYDSSTRLFSELKGKGMALGLDPAACYHQQQFCPSPGQIIIIGTDGIWETHNPERKMFGKKRLKSVIQKQAHRPAKEILAAVNQAVEDFRGPIPAEDDVTLVVIKVLS